MRKKYVVLNLLTAWGGQAVIVIFNFILRMLFVKYLSIEYLGMNGLFSNILSLLSLAEMGIGSAIIYSLYEPLAKKEETVVQSFMDFYKKAYWIIGSVILLAGSAFIPFLDWFIKDGTKIQGFEIIYFLFVLDTSVSYFFSYKISLIIANQKSFIVNIYANGVKLVKIIVSMLVISVWQNYFSYLILQMAFTLLENVLISHRADKMYPFLKEKRRKALSIEQKVQIKKNTMAMLFHRIGNIVVNGTDNLILSKFVSMASVGLLSNYNMVLNGLHTLIGQVFQAFTAGVGNYVVTEGENQQRQLFWQMFFLNFWLYGSCSVGLFCLFNPFIILWIGAEYAFSKAIVFLVVFNFFITGMRKTVLTFRDAMGLFWHDRYKAFIEAVLNLLISLFLVKQIGIAGVFLGTIISTVMTCFWIEPYILFRYGLKEKIRRYFKYYGYYLVLTVTAGMIGDYLCNYINGNDIKSFVGKAAVCVIICQLIFFIGCIPVKYTYIVIEKIKEGIRIFDKSNMKK